MGIQKIKVTNGVYWISIPEVDLRLLCGCPADVVKHLKRKGLIQTISMYGEEYETGPNAILLSDVMIQNGQFSNMVEFPVLQMLYNQGLAVPGHPNNTGEKPLLIGSKEQLDKQWEYLMRGNYGLLSKEELLNTGISDSLAQQVWATKFNFSFGEFKNLNRFIEPVTLEDESVVIKDKVSIKRLYTNIFEIKYNGQYITVDLNLGISDEYEPAYSTGYHLIEREYFAVIHSGEGNGWDPNRPSMASILLFQGKIYLIDAGPNIDKNLMSLGISINDIEGIFHTHAHDDHFAGLPLLIKSDHRIKYYSSALVRHSVFKKLTALTSIPEEEFSSYFEFHDLEMGRWNMINGLEVMPVFSPHPVETNIFYFRALGPQGYKTYAHLADISSMDVINRMIQGDDENRETLKKVKKHIEKYYFLPADLKKIDAGGGMIHGSAADFQKDPSGRIVLSHTSSEYSDLEKEIGSEAHFGMIDVLIPSRIDYHTLVSEKYLNHYFSEIPDYQLDILLNNEYRLFNPGTIIIKRNELNNHAHLILSGVVEIMDSRHRVRNNLSTGAIVGEISSLTGAPSRFTVRAKSYVKTLAIPAFVYQQIISSNDILRDIKKQNENLIFIITNRLLGESISYKTQVELIRHMTLRKIKAGARIDIYKNKQIAVIKNGEVEVIQNNALVDKLKSGEYFGEEIIIKHKDIKFQYKAGKQVELYFIPADILLKIPVIHWKMHESLNRRLKKSGRRQAGSQTLFHYRQEYSVGINVFDNQHKEILEKINQVYGNILHKSHRQVILESLNALLHYTQFHFREEEKLMKSFGYSQYSEHKKEHENILRQIINYRDDIMNENQFEEEEILRFLKSWLFDHILNHDKNYAEFFHKRGMF